MKGICVAIIVFINVVGCQPKTESIVTSDYNFQLANPKIEIGAVLFDRSTSVELALDHPGVEIFYSLEGADVSQEDTKYESPIRIDKSTEISVRAFHPDYLQSDVVSAEVIKANDFSGEITVTLSQPPHANYPGSGAQSLVDLRKGTTNFRNGGYWMGFQENSIDINLKFREKQPIKSVTLSALKDHGSWIFLPEKVQLLTDNNVIAETLWAPPKEQEPTQLKFITASIPSKITTSDMTVRVISGVIPSWHGGKDTMPWLFIDEVLIN